MADLEPGTAVCIDASKARPPGFTDSGLRVVGTITMRSVGLSRWIPAVIRGRQGRFGYAVIVGGATELLVHEQYVRPRIGDTCEEEPGRRRGERQP